MTTQQYNIVAELDVPFDEETVDRLIDPIADRCEPPGRPQRDQDPELPDACVGDTWVLRARRSA